MDEGSNGMSVAAEGDWVIYVEWNEAGRGGRGRGRAALTGEPEIEVRSYSFLSETCGMKYQRTLQNLASRLF